MLQDGITLVSGKKVAEVQPTENVVLETPGQEVVRVDPTTEKAAIIGVNDTPVVEQTGKTIVRVDGTHKAAIIGLNDTPVVEEAGKTIMRTTANEYVPKFTTVHTLAVAQANASNDPATTFALPYDIAVPVFGKPGNGATVFRFKTPRKLLIPRNFAGSIAGAAVPAASLAIFSFKVNGTEVGTISFAANSTTGVFSTTTADVTIEVGDLLTLIAPGVADSALSDIDFSLAAVL